MAKKIFNFGERLALYSDLPTNTSELNNDSGFITNAVDDLVNYYTQGQIDTKLSTVYKYKGTKETYSQLPVSDNVIGDVWNIETADSQHSIKAGDNVAWNGTTWDVLAGTVDLSNKQDIIQYSSMPTAGASNEGKIVQFTGTTDSTYTNGYFYVCISDGATEPTYSWEEIPVQASSGSSINLQYGSNGFVIENLTKGIYTFTPSISGGVAYISYKVSSNGSSKTAYIKPIIAIKYHDGLVANESNFIMYGFSVANDYTNGQYMIMTHYGTQTTTDLYYYSDGKFISTYNQTFSGTKTFNNIPQVNSYTAPTTDVQLTAKKYVDDQDKIILNNIAPQYSTSSTYNEGDHVIYNGVLYECNTTISVAEAWTPAHWTQKEILSYIDNKISHIDTTKREVVQTLPTQDIATDTIYMVPKTTPGTQNVYDEYMYINNAWELIGSTEVDLTNYYTKSEVDAMITNINNQIGNIAEVLSHLTNPVIPIGTVLYTEDVTRTVGNVTYEGTYTATLKEFHADTNYYVIDYTFENTGADDIPGAVFDEITTSPAGHLPLMAAYTIEAGETVTLTSYWQDSATYAATEARYQVPGNVSVEFDTTDNTTNYTSNLALNKLDGFNTDVVAHVHTYDSSEIDEGWTHTTFDRTGGTEDPYTVPEPFYVAWINFDTQTFGVLSEPISDTLTMTRSYIGFNADQFDQSNVAFFLAKTADVADCTWQEFEDAYYDYSGGVN